MPARLWSVPLLICVLCAQALVGQELELGDLTAIDQLAVQAMNLLCDEKAMAEKGINAENFEDVYGLDMTYPSADGTLVELVENGADHAVTSVPRTRAQAPSPIPLPSCLSLHSVTPHACVLKCRFQIDRRPAFLFMYR